MKKKRFFCVVCPMFCASEIVSVAQRLSQLSRRSRGHGKVGSDLRFPLFHAPGTLRATMLPVMAVCSPARNVV